MAQTSKPIGSEAFTEGIRIVVTPKYLPAESSPDERRYVFSYHVRMSNEGDRRAVLRTRHWVIVDAHGHRRHVEGPGVVGEFPDLAPGDHFEYASYCPLETPWGTMEGAYLMERESGEQFEAAVKRFYLVSAAPVAVPVG